MTSPTAIGEVRGLMVSQRGQALAVSAIMPPHFRQEVILTLTSLRGAP
jgi:hypothetical protein